MDQNTAHRRAVIESCEPAPIPDSLETYLDANRADLIGFSERLLGVDTQNPPGDTRAIVEWIDSTLADTDLHLERVTIDPRKPNLIATLPGESDRTLCFNGHLDTVPYDAAQWTHAPLGERRDDRLYGRGATDMKGAVAAMVHLALAFDRTDTVPPVTLQFAFVSDEEIGGAAGMPALVDHPGFHPEACVIGETTCRGGRYSVSVADRGHVWLTIQADGRAAHGSRPMIGDNAIDRLIEATDQFRTAFGGWQLAVEAQMTEIISESIRFYEPETGAEAAQALFRYPTINLGTIEGGTAINTVPASAHAKVDVRLTAGVDMGEVVEAIRDCFVTMNQITLSEVTWRAGTYVPIDSPIAAASAAAAASVIDERVNRCSATGGGDATILRRQGIPTVEFGFGTQTAHGTDEYTTTQSLQHNATAYAALPYEYDLRSVKQASKA